MALTGYLVPFPDPGAFDLMSRWLEQDVKAAGPGTITVRVTMPRIIRRPAETGGASAEVSNAGFARKKLELFRHCGGEWIPLAESVTASPEAAEELTWAVTDPGLYRTRLTNMGGMEGQFSLDCRFRPG